VSIVKKTNEKLLNQCHVPNSQHIGSEYDCIGRSGDRENEGEGCRNGDREHQNNWVLIDFDSVGGQKWKENADTRCV
jgi:hypothetical protein